MKKRIILILLLPFGFSGCTAIGNWFDSVGEHMPVIGSRCEHWQCFTESGREASDANKAKMQQQTVPDTQVTPAGNQVPANAPQALTPPAPQPPVPPGASVATPQYENPPAGEGAQ